MRSEAARSGNLKQASSPEATIRFSDLVEINPVVDYSGLKPDDPVSFIPMSDVTNNGQWAEKQTRRYVEVQKGYSVFQEGDVLFAKITPCTENGKGCHAVGLTNGIGFGSTEFHVLRVKLGINARLIYHLSVAKEVRTRAASIMGGSAGQQRVPADFFRLFQLPASLLNNQERKADLFDAVDDAIEATRAVIEQTRNLKAVLLDDLIVNGLPGRRDRFKQFCLGELFSERKERGRPGLPVLSVTMDQGLVGRDTLDRRVVSELGPEDHLLVRKGDIAYNMMRMWQGVFGLAWQDGIVSPAYVVLKPSPEINSHFAVYLFKHPGTIRKFERFSQGLTGDRLRLYYDQFCPIPVRIPDKQTQSKIATVLQSIDDRSLATENKLESLLRLKIALSQGLLTGRIPVKVGGVY